MDPTNAEDVAGSTEAEHALVLVPPVQLAVRCSVCSYERSALALHPQALEEALRCERCRQPNEVLWHRAKGEPHCPTCAI